MISTAVFFCCVVLVASPFQMQTLGDSSFTLRTAIWNGLNCACVSFITQKCVFAAAPSVVKECTLETIGSPSFAS